MQPAQQQEQAAVHLAVLRRGEKPRLYRLEAATLTIGRADDVGLRLDDPAVAPRHARLQPDGSGGWQVVDLGSEGGTYLDGERLTAEVVTGWAMDATVRIGPFFLRWHPLEGQGPEAEGAATPANEEAERTAGGAAIRIAVEPVEVVLERGEQVTLQVELTNQGSQVDHCIVDLHGLPREWVSTSHEFLRLVPGGRASVPVTLHPPESEETQPGEHRFRLIVTSSVQEREVAAVEGAVMIPVHAQFEATLEPPRWRHRRDGRVRVRNGGNIPLRLVVGAKDAAGQVDFGEPQRLVVTPGRVGEVVMRPEAVERPLLIREQVLPFTAVVQPREMEAREVAGEVVVPPRFTLGCLLVAGLPLLVIAVVLAGISLGLIYRELPTIGESERYDGPLGHYIREQWAEGMEIDTLTGDEGVWLVVMGDAETPLRQTWQVRTSFPAEFVAQQWEAGWAISDLSFGNGRWLLVMAQGGAALRQRWELAPAFPEAAIAAAIDAGYAVSDLAYGHGVWALVMSQGGESGKQRWQVAPEFPEEFIREQAAAGFHVSDVAHGPEGWAVVMTHSAVETQQVWQTAAVFPGDFIDLRWQEGYDISEVARGDGVWVVVMTRVPGNERRQEWQAAETLR